MLYVSRFWQYLTAPVFNATTETNGKGAVTVIAGQRTRICTIKLSLVAEGKFKNPREDIGFPRPSINNVPPGVKVSFSEDRRPRREELELDVYVHVTSAGKYSITPEFPEALYNFRSIDKKTVHIYVKPSELQFVELSSIAPVPGHGNAGRLYRGGTADIRVAPKDEFGNFITAEGDADLKFNIPSCSLCVTLLSVVPNTQDNYVVKIRCADVGRGPIELIVLQGNRQVKKEFPLEVIPPPVSAVKSYIIQSDINEIQEKLHEAGQAITLKLNLIDIFGNAKSYEESTSFVERICLTLHDTSHVPVGDQDSLKIESTHSTRHQENSSKMCPNSDVHSRYANASEANSLILTAEGKPVVGTKRHNSNLENTTPKVRPLDMNSNICEVGFTPNIAGSRQVSLFAGSKTEEISTMTMRVQPGPLEELKIVKQDPTDFRNVYRGDTAKICVKAIDEFGNRIDSNLKFAIFSDSSLVKLLSTDYDDVSKQGSHQLTIHWGTIVGKGTFDMIVSQGNRQVKQEIPFEVIPPPVSAAKSYIIRSDINEIQGRLHEAGQPITFSVKFIDILGNPIPSEESIQDQNQFRLDSNDDIYPNWSCESQYCPKNDRPLTVRPSAVDSNVCELEFTAPPEAGKRLYFLSVGGEMLDNFEIAVLPREGGNVQVLKNLQRESGNYHEEREEIRYENGEYFEFYKCDQKILCLGVKRRHLVGEDNANINNINRVLEKAYPSCKLAKDLVSWKYGLLVVIDLSSFQENAAFKVFDLLSDLVKGHHYRNEANEFAKEREKWDKEEKEAIEGHNYTDRIEADRCRRLKFKCGRKMHESNEKASDAIFKFYNHNRPQSDIDLHGQRVGNTEKLKELEANLQRENKTPNEIKEIIEQRRKKTDEAIRKLDERLRNFDHEKAKRDGEDWLEIIDGAGHHSARRGEQKIRPKVKEYLKKKNMKYVEANEGALLITFSEYTGREPCVADFYCTRCTRKWTSTTSWKGFFQRCHRCDSEGTISNCYPFKLRSVPPERRRENVDFRREDHRRLCQMCIQLGRDCRQR